MMILSLFMCLPLLIPSSAERRLCGSTCYDPRVFFCCGGTQTNAGTTVGAVKPGSAKRLFYVSSGVWGVKFS